MSLFVRAINGFLLWNSLECAKLFALCMCGGAAL
jgi:hypothetical protein